MTIQAQPTVDKANLIVCTGLQRDTEHEDDTPLINKPSQPCGLASKSELTAEIEN